jgi:hypothetical protein
MPHVPWFRAGVMAPLVLKAKLDRKRARKGSNEDWVNPRGLQGASADALLAFLRFWIAVLAHTGQEGIPLPWLICSRAPHIEILISLAAM